MKTEKEIKNRFYKLRKYPDGYESEGSWNERVNWAEALKWVLDSKLIIEYALRDKVNKK